MHRYWNINEATSINLSRLHFRTMAQSESSLFCRQRQVKVTATRLGIKLINNNNYDHQSSIDNNQSAKNQTYEYLVRSLPGAETALLRD